MKKAISVFLAASMMLSMFSVGAYAANVESSKRLVNAQNMIAQDLGDGKLTTELVRTVAHDQQLLEKVFLSRLVEISEVDSDGTVTYEIPYETTTEYISVKEDHEGNIILYITDNNKFNELIYKKDGRIFLDGYEVTVEDSNMVSDEQNSNTILALEAPSQIVPYAGINRQFYGATATFYPSGTAYSPSGFVSTGNDFTGRTISYGQIIKSIALSAIISTFCSALAPSIAAAAEASLIVSDVATLLDVALRFKEIELAAIAGQCVGTVVTADVYEHAKTTNNSLYSVFHYNVAAHFSNGTLYTASRYSFEAT